MMHLRDRYAIFWNGKKLRLSVNSFFTPNKCGPYVPPSPWSRSLYEVNKFSGLVIHPLPHTNTTSQCPCLFFITPLSMGMSHVRGRKTLNSYRFRSSLISLYKFQLLGSYQSSGYPLQWVYSCLISDKKCLSDRPKCRASLVKPGTTQKYAWK